MTRRVQDSVGHGSVQADAGEQHSSAGGQDRLEIFSHRFLSARMSTPSAVLERQAAGQYLQTISVVAISLFRLPTRWLRHVLRRILPLVLAPLPPVAGFLMNTLDVVGKRTFHTPKLCSAKMAYLPLVRRLHLCIYEAYFLG